MIQQAIGLALVLAILTLGFGLLERFWNGGGPARRHWRALLLDIGYWFFTPMVTKLVTRGAILVVAITAVIALGWPLKPETLQSGFGPIGRLHPGVQFIGAFLLADFLGYWSHRLFHGRWLWKFHAIHHASEELNWLSAVRLHPVNDAGAKVIAALPILLLGFRPTVLAACVPLITLHAIFLHANVPWDFGPFRTILASPVFHRWHHATDPEAIDKNFGGILPVWDLLFGTYYLPKDRLPTHFGVKERVPETLLGQLAYPFRPEVSDEGFSTMVVSGGEIHRV